MARHGTMLTVQLTDKPVKVLDANPARRAILFCGGPLNAASFSLSPTMVKDFAIAMEGWENVPCILDYAVVGDLVCQPWYGILSGAGPEPVAIFEVVETP